MALKIIREAEANMPGDCKADRRLCLTNDKSRVVEADDRTAGWLFSTQGTDISEADMKRFSLESVDGKIVLPGTRAREPSPVKSREKTEDKADSKEGDKSVKKTEGKSSKRS